MLDDIKQDLQQFPNDWLKISQDMRSLSLALRADDPLQIAPHLLDLLAMCIQIAAHYDIDLDVAWTRWKKKAVSKKYF